MTTEGSFPLGGAVLCNCHYNRGFTICSDSFRGRSRNACRFSDWFTIYKKEKFQLFLAGIFSDVWFKFRDFICDEIAK